MKKLLYILLAVTMLSGIIALPVSAESAVTDFEVDVFGFENDTLTMEVTRKYKLCPVFTPADASAEITYTPARPSIAYIEDGTILALSHGTTEITAECNGIKKTFTVVVNASGPAYDATKAVVPGTPDFLGTSNADQNYAPPETMTIGNRSYKLSLFDDFKGESINYENWNHSPEWRRKSKPGWWRDEAAYVDGNGILYIDNYVTDYPDNSYSGAAAYKASNPGIDYSFATGALDSKKKVEQAYGYWEICCAIPRVTGYWASFWLLSDSIGEQDDGGRYGCEVDIFEAIVAANSIYHTVHWNGYNDTQNIGGATNTSEFFSNGFHTVGFEWTEDMYIFYLDGYETWRSNQGTADEDYPLMNICEEPLYINICCEFGDWAGEDRFDLYPSAYLVDYVRVYDLESQDGEVSTEKEAYNNGITEAVIPSVAVTGISVNCDEEITIDVGQTVQIYAEKTPLNATLDTTRGKLKYATSASSVAKVDNSTCAVTGIAPGTANITITADKAGTVTKVIKVNVKNPGETVPTTAPTTAPAIVKGDVSGDGKVIVADAMMLFQFVAGTKTSLNNPDAADVTGDGDVTIADAMKLFRFVAGVINTL